MSYAGNPSLAPEVRSRIVETFRHTLDVAARGSLEEARLGCDFILQLDPLFAPAQTLSDRLRAAAGPVSVEDLLQRLDGDGAGAAGAAAPAAASPGPELRDELARLVAARDFAGLNRRVQQAQGAIAADPSLQGLLSSAQELAEAAPYVDRFLDQARTALAHGRPGDARAALDKARALDPDHPALAPLREHAGGSAAADAATFAATPELPAPAGIDLSDSPSAGEMSLDLEPIDLPDLGGGGASDPDPRVAELLDEGQGLYERGELQSAIDAWSRVFLIDIDHQEAARRIDVARNAKAEQERRLEEVFHEALAKLQAGSIEEGRADLERLVAEHPHHLAARDALAKLERGEVAVPPPALAAADALAEAGSDPAVLQEEILVPPEPGQVAKRPAPPPIAAAPESRRTLLIAGVGILVVLLAAGWFLRSRWSSLFPNTDEAPAVQAPQQSPITRATQLAAEGKRPMAIAQLKRVPPPSPYYEEAQALIAQWEAEEAAAQSPTGPSADQIASREALVAQARTAQGERRYLRVLPALAQAATIAPLSPEEEALKLEAEEALLPLKLPLELIRNEESQQALRELWLKLEADPGNADARELLVTAYFNMGIGSLQGGRTEDAAAHFREAAQLAPNDADIQRARLLAETYQERQLDLLYRIYVKYLTPRKV
jgi:tetratricopeptide (TPR) repeat protein